MTKDDLARQISIRTEVSIPKAKEMIDEFMNQIIKSTEKAESVFLRGFGTFEVRHRAPRKARVVSTGEPMMTEDLFAPFFRPCKEYKARIKNKVFAVRV